MKNKYTIYILLVFFSLSFVFSACEKQVLTTDEDMYGVTEFKQKIQNGILVEVKEKSTTLYDSLEIDGVLYYYYPDPNNLNEKQEIFFTNEEGKNIVLGVFPNISTGTYSYSSSVSCSGLSRNCIAIAYNNGLVIYH
ncbi:MAG: hypothetical protein JXR68_07915 [Bacteroidales bacterium]|nr:hypothetical protein [Bacteroidales bacterium]